MTHEIHLTNGEVINIVVAVDNISEEEEEDILIHLFEEYCIVHSYSYQELCKFEKCN